MSKPGTAIVATTDPAVMSALKNSIYPGANDESIAMVLSYCQAAGLDPLQKPVHIVPMSVKQGKDYIWRDVVMPGIGLYRTQASRSGEHAGTSEPEFGEMVVTKLGSLEFTYPEWCKVTVTKIVQGQLTQYSAKEYWIENYATAGKDKLEPNAMWRKRPRGQLAKCAEAQALRKAFPELGSQPTAEEMEGKIIDVTGAVIPNEADGSAELLKKWVDAANAAGNAEILKKVWTDGLNEIRAAKDMPAYNALKAAVETKGKAFTATEKQPEKSPEKELEDMANDIPY